MASLWRETSFAYHLIKQAINPVLSFKRCLKNWGIISKNLSESRRKRRLQHEKYFC